MAPLGVIEITMSDFFCTRSNQKIPKTLKKSPKKGILFFRPVLQAIYIHIGAKAFLKEHFSNTSISTRYFFNYYAVLEYMLYKYLVEKLMDKNETSPLKKVSLHCWQEPAMLIHIFFSSHFERFAFTPLLCGHRGQVLNFKSGVNTNLSKLSKCPGHELHYWWPNRFIKLHSFFISCLTLVRIC